MKIKEYYEKNPSYGFFVKAYNLYPKEEINEFLLKFDFIKEQDADKIRSTRKRLSIFFSRGLDEFHFFLVRLSVICELCLKGIALDKEFNIFKIRTQKMMHYNDINIDDCKSHEFSFFINNLDKLLDTNLSNKYRDMLKFFMIQRNEILHISKKEYTFQVIPIIENIKLMKEFFEEIILFYKEKSALKESLIKN